MYSNKIIKRINNFYYFINTFEHSKYKPIVKYIFTDHFINKININILAGLY